MNTHNSWEGFVFWSKHKQFCFFPIERSHQWQLTLKAALEYNAVLSPQLAEKPGTNRLHGKKIALLDL